MSMTVARYRRTWTTALRNEFLADVNAARKKYGVKSSEAYEVIGNKWGLGTNSVKTLFWNFRAGKNSSGSSKFRPVNYVPATSLKDESQTDIQKAIELLKAAGATITF